MKGFKVTPDGKYEILSLRFKDFDTLPRSLLLFREEEPSFASED
ncbi:MAG: hypothetical protein ACE5IJ_07595 [Thermoplasmata archaeon]